MSEEPVAPQRGLDPSAPHPPSVLQSPINIRSTSLAVLALLAVIGFLFLARAVFIPITIAVLASYALTPVVDWLKRRARLPKVLGAGLTLALILVGLGLGLESLQPQALAVLDIVPNAAQKFGTALRSSALGPPGAVEKMKKAASEIEKAASAAATPANVRRSPRRRVPPAHLPLPRLSTSGTTS